MPAPRHRDRILHRIVYELRYDEGYTYLDRCGRTLNRLLGEFPEWEVSSVDPGSGQIVHRHRNKTFSFSCQKLDMGQNQDQQVKSLDAPHDFAAEAEKLSNIVIEELGVSSYPRIGLRAWNLFGVRSTEEAHSFVIGMKALHHEAVTGCIGGTATAGGFSVLLDMPGVVWRVAVATVEQRVSSDPSMLRRMATSTPHRQPSDQRRALLDKIRAEKALATFPPVAVLVDIDAYVEDPGVPDDLKIADFISEQLDRMNEAAEKVMALGE